MCLMKCHGHAVRCYMRQAVCQQKPVTIGIDRCAQNWTCLKEPSSNGRCVIRFLPDDRAKRVLAACVPDESWLGTPIDRSIELGWDYHRQMLYQRIQRVAPQSSAGCPHIPSQCN